MTEKAFLEKLERCVRCGTCKTVCPTYEAEHNETLSGRGRLVILKGMLSGDLPKKPSAMGKVLSCIQCGACAQKCPLGLEIPELIYTGRSLLRTTPGSGALLRFATRLFLNHPDSAFRLSRGVRRPIEGYLRKRGFVPEDFSFPRRKEDLTASKLMGTKHKGTVLLFAGCSTRYLYPHLGDSVVRVLSRLGYQVLQPAGEVCCGAPFRTLGMEREAVSFMKKNIGIFCHDPALATVSLCPTCVLALKKESRTLLGSSLENVMEVTEFLLHHEPDLFARKKGGDMTRDVYYHDPCHMKYGLGLITEPRSVLESIGLRPLNEVSDMCCGFGGTFSIRYREFSSRLAASIGETINSSGTEEVYTSCPGCIHQLRKVNSGPVYHVIEAVEKALQE